MRIDTPFLTFANQRLAPARDPQRAWRSSGAGAHHLGPRRTGDIATISDAARDAVRAARASETGAAGDSGDQQMRFIAALVKAVTGQDVRITGIEDPTFTATTEHTAASISSVSGVAGPGGTQLALHAASLESETTAIEASAIVHTADGQDLKVTISFTMSRSSLETNDVAFPLGGTGGDTPAVHFDGDAAALGPRRFTFDLPGDATHDVAAPRHGAGLLLIEHGNARPSSAEIFAARPGKAYEEVGDHDGDTPGHVDEDGHAYRFLKHLANEGAGDGESPPPAASEGPGGPAAGAVQQVDLSA